MIAWTEYSLTYHFIDPLLLVNIIHLGEVSFTRTTFSVWSKMAIRARK